ncbi:alpha/beta hydrolase [Spirosoma sp. KNUC1025]|uniref:alpha/beta hydrolase n=1 Tax=Spirosoma sp. KNUC1025 TaxID=2894082 RepID=UPI003866CE6A|nr:alpha/beta hydrolase [Spirosoma sp. KNUC1025]
MAAIFTLMNIVAYFHAYKFTHFTRQKGPKTNAEKLSTLAKINTLIFGIDNPRPENEVIPTKKFDVINLQSNKKIECWSLKPDSSKGTVILFHGYGGSKSSMLDTSEELIKQGFSTLLVDFMGSGGSEGYQTTIGFDEAEEVKTCFDYLTEKGERTIYLFGTSLGAVAIMKSIHDYQIQPTGIIIQCPFGSMYQTTCIRFNTMRVPPFPMAGFLVFWGGIQNGFWAFGHNPIDYAKSIKCPTLLIYGEQDKKVSRRETDQIYSNLSCQKNLKIYPQAGHGDYLTTCKKEWLEDIKSFIELTRQ